MKGNDSLKHKDDNTQSSSSWFFFPHWSLLWKIEDNNNHIDCHHLHFLMLVLVPLKHKDNLCLCHLLCIFFSSLYHSYEKQNMTTIFDRHFLCLFLMFLMILDTKTMTHNYRLCVFFSSFIALVKDKSWCKLLSSSPPPILTPLRHEDDGSMLLSLCLLFLAFFIPMKDRKWQQSMIVIVYTSYSCSSQTRKQWHRVIIFVCFLLSGRRWR